MPWLRLQTHFLSKLLKHPDFYANKFHKISADSEKIGFRRDAIGKGVCLKLSPKSVLEKLFAQISQNLNVF